MRRTGSDPLLTAEDLSDALYYTDVLETLRGVDDPAAVPHRAEAYMGLGRFQEAANAYRQMLRTDPNDEAAVMGLALAVAWLGDGQAALDLYATVDSPESRVLQAQLLAADEPELALAYYLESPDPAAWEIIAGGFRDTSRVAGSDVTMMVDILMTNREKVLHAVDVYRAKLRDLARLVETSDEKDLRAALSAIRDERIRMYP